jgi:hypothetical protein
MAVDEADNDTRAAQAAHVVLGIPIIVLKAAVGARLWGWFVVPLGPPRIGVAHTFGLMLIVALLRRWQPRTKETSEEAIEHLAMVTFGTLAIWALGLCMVTVMT